MMLTLITILALALIQRNILFILNTYVFSCSVLTYTPPGNQLLLCVASVVK